MSVDLKGLIATGTRGEGFVIPHKLLAALLVLVACSSSPDASGSSDPDPDTSLYEVVREIGRGTSRDASEEALFEGVSQEVSVELIDEVHVIDAEEPEDRVCSEYLTNVQDCVTYFVCSSYSPGSCRWDHGLNCCTCLHPDCGNPCDRGTDCEGHCVACLEDGSNCAFHEEPVKGFCTPSYQWFSGSYYYLDDDGNPFNITSG